MKKYMIIALSLCAPLHCMDNNQLTTHEPREWDAHAYDTGCFVQTSAFLHFLQTNNIKTKDRTILDAGCGTGQITAKLAENAKSIHGFDASKNMISLAQKNFNHIKNLSFEHCFAEDFQSQKRYQLGLMSCCFHWIENKQMALQRMNDSLEDKGDFFAIITTKNNPVPLNLIAASEKIETIQSIFKWFTNKDLIDLTGSSFPSNEELNNMLNEAGFEIITSEEQSFTMPLTKDEVIKTEWPIVSSRPIMKYIPDMFIQSFFDDYIDIYLKKLPQADDGKFLEVMTATIVHARKVKK